MDHHGSSGLTALVAFVLGGLVVNYVGEAAALCAAISGLGALVGRYRAILRSYGARRVRHATAIGFFVGLGFSAVVVVADVVLASYA